LIGSEDFLSFLVAVDYLLPQESLGKKCVSSKVLSPRSTHLTTERGNISKGTREDYADKDELCQGPSNSGTPNVVESGNLNMPESVHPLGKPFECQYCDKAFNRNSTLKRHIRIHTNEKPFVCPVCDKAFRAGDALKVHERIHTGDKPYKCKYPNCDKAYAHPMGLDFHINSVHTGKRNFLCDLCGLGFLSKSCLRSHRRRHEPKTDERPFQCEYCEKAFRTKPTLVGHTRIHTGEKPRKCRYCELSFTTSGQRFMHERIHTGVKPFKCDHCEKAFRVRGACIEHMNIHTGEKPFKCQVCDKKFAAKSNCRGHEKMHQREADTKDKI
jgi:KRAB domain-containing zinc finger protein